MNKKYKLLTAGFVFLIIFSLAIFVFRQKINSFFYPSKPSTYSVANFNNTKLQKLKVNDILTGKGIPGGKVNLFFSPGGLTSSQIIEPDGSWKYTLPDRLKTGKYILSVELTDKSNKLISLNTINIQIINSLTQIPINLIKQAKADESSFPLDFEGSLSVNMNELSSSQLFQVWKSEAEKYRYLIKVEENDVVLRENPEPERYCSDEDICPEFKLTPLISREIGYRLRKSYKKFFENLMESLNNGDLGIKYDSYVALKDYFPEIYQPDSGVNVEFFQNAQGLYGIDDEYNKSEKTISEDQLRTAINRQNETGSGIGSAAEQKDVIFLESRFAFFKALAKAVEHYKFESFTIKRADFVSSSKYGIRYFDASDFFNSNFADIRDSKEYQGAGVAKYFQPVNTYRNEKVAGRLPAETSVTPIPHDVLIELARKVHEEVEEKEKVEFEKTQWLTKFSDDHLFGSAMITLTDPIFCTKAWVNLFTNNHFEGEDALEAALSLTLIAGPILSGTGEASAPIARAAIGSFGTKLVIADAASMLQEARILRQAGSLSSRILNERAAVWLKEGSKDVVEVLDKAHGVSVGNKIVAENIQVTKATDTTSGKTAILEVVSYDSGGNVVNVAQQNYRIIIEPVLDSQQTLFLDRFVKEAKAARIDSLELESIKEELANATPVEGDCNQGCEIPVEKIQTPGQYNVKVVLLDNEGNPIAEDSTIITVTTPTKEIIGTDLVCPGQENKPITQDSEITLNQLPYGDTVCQIRDRYEDNSNDPNPQTIILRRVEAEPAQDNMESEVCELPHNYWDPNVDNQDGTFGKCMHKEAQSVTPECDYSFDPTELPEDQCY